MKSLNSLYQVSCIAILVVAIAACNSSNQSANTDTEKVHYGPVDKQYNLPDVKGSVYFVAPDGDPDSDGLSTDEPTTIEAAISQVVSGDAIVMRGGTYRTGNLTFNQGITIQPYQDEKPVLKGTRVADDWQQAGEDLWYTPWEHLFPAGPEDWWRREREEKYTPMHRFNNDGVFIDGDYLQSAGSKEEVDAGTYFVDYEANEIYIGTDPTNKLVEITAFRKAIFRTTGEVHGKKSDGKGPVIRGLEITQYPDTMVHIDGYKPEGISPEHEHGKDVVGTVLENCTFSNCFRIGVFTVGDSLTMRNCKIIDSNTEGLYIVSSSDVLLENNIFAHNNIERWTGFYPAAVKIFNQSYRVTCRENLVTDHPHSNGIWYDVGNVDGVFVNNRIEKVGSVDKSSRDDRLWPSNNGFFFEISKGAICAGNVFVDCDHGILVLNSRDVKIYNNTLVNSMATIGRTARGDDPDHFGWHPNTGPGVEERYGHAFVNNLITYHDDYTKPQFFVWQPADLCERLNKPQLDAMDHNLYVRQQANDTAALMFWSPYDNEKCQARLQSPEALHELHPPFAANSKYINGYEDPIYRDVENNDFRLSEEFSAMNNGTVLPDNVVKVMNLDEGQEYKFTGAYQVD